mgnify:CR=1 FL=1
MTWVKQTAGWPTPVRLSVWLWRRIRTARALNPGDVVAIPAGLKHWHGAAKDSWFSHVVFGTPARAALPGGASRWMRERTMRCLEEDEGGGPNWIRPL